MSNTETEDQYIESQSGQLFVRQWIPGNCSDLAPMILMHDSLGCVGLWRDFPEQLASSMNRKVIAYDRLGFGQSTARHNMLPFSFVGDEAKTVIPLLCDVLEVSDFLMLGHSVGGAMALSVAAINTNCKAVVSISSQAFVEERTREGIREARESFRDPQSFSKLEKWHHEKSEWVLNAWTNTWLAPGFASWNLNKELASVFCPVLVIHGEQDEYGSVAFPDMIANSTKGVTQKEIYQECGHVPHREQPVRLLASVLHFVEKNSI